MKRSDRIKELADNLQSSYEHWYDMIVNGCNDPFWPDGTNLNLVRNHIIFYKRQCETELEKSEYPQEFYKELPPEVDNDYMAKKKEIMDIADEVIKKMISNTDYRYIVRMQEQLTEVQKKSLNLSAITSIPEQYEKDRKRGDLVSMRRSMNIQYYADRVKRMRNEVERILSESNSRSSGKEETVYTQLSIFDILTV